MSDMFRVIKGSNVTPSSRIPFVGEFWHHSETDSVFLRIRDDVGAKALSREVEGVIFYSIDMGDNRVVYTRKTSDDIVLLKPASEDGVFWAVESEASDEF